MLSPRAITQLTYGHKDIIYLVVGFCRCLHEQEAFGPCKLFPLLGGDKQSYFPSPLGGCLFGYSGISWWVNNCTGTLEVSESLFIFSALLGHIPVLAGKGVTRGPRCSPRWRLLAPQQGPSCCPPKRQRFHQEGIPSPGPSATALLF